MDRSWRIILLFGCVSLTFGFLDSESLHLRPIVGIVAQKVTAKYTPNVTKSDYYIAASYVKFVEMSGAQAVALVPSYPKKKLEKLLNNINGVLFPGGAAPLDDSGYYKTAKMVFNKAKALNDAGTYFPIFGICLGFETLHALTGQQPNKEGDILSKFNSENYTIPLNLTKDAFRSRMFKNISIELLEATMFEQLTLNMHHMGVSPAVYGKNKAINAMFRVLSINTDRDGKDFVSTVEGINYPFYGTQWHPEKNLFEWTIEEAINHSPHAIMLAQYLSFFFISECRKNSQHFDDFKEEAKNVMSQYSPVYSGGRSLFEQVYVFGAGTSVYIQNLSP